MTDWKFDATAYCQVNSNGHSYWTIVSTTRFARECKSILDRVVNCGELVEIQRYGKTVAVIRPQAGVTRSEILRILRGRGFSRAESRELRNAIAGASEVVGYAGRK